MFAGSVMKKALIVSVLTYLSACSSTPKINIIDSMGMTMELAEPSLYILSVGIDKYKDPSVTLRYAAKDVTDIEKNCSHSRQPCTSPRTYTTIS